MTDAPERIWMHTFELHPELEIPPNKWKDPRYAVEYILADITPSPEVVKELVEALRWISNNPSAHRTNMVKVADDALAKLEGGE